MDYKNKLKSLLETTYTVGKKIYQWTMSLLTKDYKKSILFTVLVILSLLVYLKATQPIPQKPLVHKFPVGYHDPRDLFYTCLKGDGCYISQNVKEHFSRNGYLAIDIGTNKRSVPMYAPSVLTMTDRVKDKEVIYKAYKVINKGTTGLTAKLVYGNKAFYVGHMKTLNFKDGDEVKTGDKIGMSGGCEGELLYNEASTGCHVHFEHRVEGHVTPYPDYLYSLHGDRLQAYKDRYKGESLKPDDLLYSKFTKYPIMPKVLSEIHQRETGRCIRNCHVSPVGARGGMQFMKNTWKEYGCDGDGDSVADVENIEDSICGAAKYMTYLFEAKGKGQNPGLAEKWQMWKALYIYNAGYTRDSTHKEGLSGGVAYADAITNLVYK